MLDDIYRKIQIFGALLEPVKKSDGKKKRKSRKKRSRFNKDKLL